MCSCAEKICSLTCMLPTLLLVLINIALTITVLVFVSDQGDKLEFAEQWLNSHLNIEQIAEYVDLSHYPSRPSEFFDRPEVGECCNNMCRGSRCFAGTAFLMRSDHCNNCCFQLTTPDSCSDYSCTCYANDQSESNRRRNVEDDITSRSNYQTMLTKIDRFLNTTPPSNTPGRFRRPNKSK